MLKMVARAARFYFNTFTVVIESPSAGIAFFVVLLLFVRVDCDALHRFLVRSFGLFGAGAALTNACKRNVRCVPESTVYIPTCIGIL